MIIRKNMLQEIVTDESLVWDRFSVDYTKFLVNLSYESINELKCISNIGSKMAGKVRLKKEITKLSGIEYPR